VQASEDDAIKTRTHIPLPVDSFSKRLDNLVVVRDAHGPFKSWHKAFLQGLGLMTMKVLLVLIAA